MNFDKQSLEEIAMYTGCNKDVLRRGKEYANRGNVLSFETHGALVSGTVEGNEGDYTVDLVRSSNGAIRGYCDCQYREFHPYCKHIVALGLHVADFIDDEAEIEEDRSYEYVIDKIKAMATLKPHMPAIDVLAVLKGEKSFTLR